MNGDFAKYENASSDNHLKLSNLNCETFIFDNPFPKNSTANSLICIKYM